ncbi:hypothetical protein P4V86_03185 [Brevibacillus laterosporus]|uniref:hypothetical protein n=1 Tax=Brevibacillus laterosporus TaxID=1465 RepID=UPI0012DF1C58|nr:hypothetical protein [Brevibacillus laterosporus]MED2002361.1 hypothetical protein [Brevibacillus laterosporus]
MSVNLLSIHWCRSTERELRRGDSTPADQTFPSLLAQAVMASAVTTTPNRPRPTTKTTAVVSETTTAKGTTQVHPIAALSKFNHYRR